MTTISIGLLPKITKKWFIYLFIITGQVAQLICPGKKITRICMEVISYND